MNIFDNDVELDEKVDVTTDKDDKRGVFLHNDEYNTFEHVIDSLVEVCEMSTERASNCAHEVHTKGKSLVVEDKPMDELRRIQLELKVRGLDARLK